MSGNLTYVFSINSISVFFKLNGSMHLFSFKVMKV